MNTVFKVAAVLIAAGLLVGCSSNPPKPDANYAPVRPSSLAPAPKADGAIYQAGYDVALFEDIRAHRVGDLLTVVLVENTSANKSARSGVAKTNDTAIANPTLFGSTPLFSTHGVLPLADTNNNTLEFGLSSSTDFTGSGTASQSNALTGNITVSVVEVLPNRNLLVRGEKRIGINQGTEYIRLSGIVRPQDISPENFVESTRIADPTITYEGEGMVSDATSMGWLSRFFNSVFAPF